MPVTIPPEIADLLRQRLAAGGMVGGPLGAGVATPSPPPPVAGPEVQGPPPISDNPYLQSKPPDIFHDPAKLEAIRNISEGLGKIGESVGRGSLISAGLNPNWQQPYEATGIRRQIGLLDRDRLAAMAHGERMQDYAWKSGEAEKGRAFQDTQLEKRLAGQKEIAQIRSSGIGTSTPPPSVADFLASKGIDTTGMDTRTAIQVAGLRMRDEENRGRDTRSQANLNRRDQSIEQVSRRLGLSQEAMNRITPGQLDKLAGYEQTTLKLRKLEEKLPDIVGGLGPIEGRLKKLMVDIGIADASTSETVAGLTDALGAYLTAQTGAQRGMKEVEWLSRTMPDIDQNPEQFLATLHKIQNLVTGDYDTYINVLKKGKKDVSGFEGKTAPSANAMKATTTSDTIEVTWPKDGSKRRIKNIPEARAEAKAAGYTVPGE